MKDIIERARRSLVACVPNTHMAMQLDVMALVEGGGVPMPGADAGVGSDLMAYIACERVEWLRRPREFDSTQGAGLDDIPTESCRPTWDWSGCRESERGCNVLAPTALQVLDEDDSGASSPNRAGWVPAPRQILAFAPILKPRPMMHIETEPNNITELDSSAEDAIAAAWLTERLAPARIRAEGAPSPEAISRMRARILDEAARRSSKIAA